MSQTTQSDLIGITDVAAKIPQFIGKLPHLVTGLKQAYLRTPNSPAGLGIAFEKAVKRNPHGYALLFEEQNILTSNSMIGQTKSDIIICRLAHKKVTSLL